MFSPSGSEVLGGPAAVIPPLHVPIVSLRPQHVRLSLVCFNSPARLLKTYFVGKSTRKKREVPLTDAPSLPQYPYAPGFLVCLTRQLCIGPCRQLHHTRSGFAPHFIPYSQNETVSEAIHLVRLITSSATMLILTGILRRFSHDREGTSTRVICLDTVSGTRAGPRQY